ncbi:hypothetical protein SAMN02982919_00954 [Giesbergeria anulus]|uniref:Uncharacterized protein n=1 Tax=Giesbergeria anulus TaxID=180197 RepID=A0A1H9HY39_9BURK|nr:hypothetical protein SAMN02982919_00954 [Giesbergeria anulus]
MRMVTVVKPQKCRLARACSLSFATLEACVRCWAWLCCSSSQTQTVKHTAMQAKTKKAVQAVQAVHSGEEQKKWQCRNTP